jgi:hypothetical protein
VNSLLPVPSRGDEGEDEPDDRQPEAGARSDADVVADIDRLIAEHTAPTPARDPRP